MTPERFTGTWRRTTISVDGAPPTEPAHVVWVQAGDHFADLRVPRLRGGRAASFAGGTSWHEPHLRWRHEIDLDAGQAEDVGAMSVDGDDLVEEGGTELEGRTVTYVERWRRQPRSDGEVLALRRDDGFGLLVQTGDHALSVCDDRGMGGEHRACYWTRTGSRWTPSLVLGPTTPLPPAPPARPVDAGDVLLGGDHWSVVSGRDEQGPPPHIPSHEGAPTR